MFILIYVSFDRRKWGDEHSWLAKLNISATFEIFRIVRFNLFKGIFRAILTTIISFDFPRLLFRSHNYLHTFTGILVWCIVLTWLSFFLVTFYSFFPAISRVNSNNLHRNFTVIIITVFWWLPVPCTIRSPSLCSSGGESF